MDHRDLKSARGRWLCRFPLLAAAAVICLLSGLSLFRLMTAAAPRNPWEAIEIVEAWRSLTGMPVYELTPDGHATHMYGALVPWLQGELFRWIGPNNVSGRALSLVSALLTVTVLALCMKNGRSLWYLAIGWAAILGVNHRSGHYFAENRPDMPALLFATLAMVLFWCGQNRRRGLYFALGSACLVIGFFIKQTVVIFSAVPMVVLFLRWRRPLRSEALCALLPLAVSAGTIVTLKTLSPTVYHYMVRSPRRLLDQLASGHQVSCGKCCSTRRCSSSFWVSGSFFKTNHCVKTPACHGCSPYWPWPFRLAQSRMPRLGAGPTACCPLSWR